MASLDDFFAKKDKSKKKKKSKFTTDELMGMKDDGEQEKKKEKQETAQSSQTAVQLQLGADDEEWHDFEQETEKDYSGLRIQNLQIGKEGEEEEEETAEGEEEVDEDGEIIKRDPGEDGPWKSQRPTASAPSEPEPVAVAPPPPAEPVTTEEKSAPAKYVPPSMRNRDSASSGSSTQHSRLVALRRKKTAPNVDSEEDFPSLGGKSEQLKQYEQEVRSGRQFEEVRGGGMRSISENKGPDLQLGNQFDALQGQH